MKPKEYPGASGALLLAQAQITGSRSRLMSGAARDLAGGKQAPQLTAAQEPGRAGQAGIRSVRPEARITSDPEGWLVD